MATKKYYAIKSIDGVEVNEILNTWAECEKRVKHHKAIYKSFTDIAEAEKFIKGDEKKVDTKEGLVAYTDGSWSEPLGSFSYGVVLIKDEVIIDILGGRVKDRDTGRQIQGELMASIEAIQAGIHLKEKKITIMHDYLGVANHSFLGIWKAKTDSAKEYRDKTVELKENIDINFVHVKGHGENVYNSLVDSVVKQALNIKLSDNINTTLLKVDNEEVFNKLMVLGVNKENIEIQSA